LSKCPNEHNITQNLIFFFLSL